MKRIITIAALFFAISAAASSPATNVSQKDTIVATSTFLSNMLESGIYTYGMLSQEHVGSNLVLIYADHVLIMDYAQVVRWESTHRVNEDMKDCN